MAIFGQNVHKRYTSILLKSVSDTSKVIIFKGSQRDFKKNLKLQLVGITPGRVFKVNPLKCGDHLWVWVWIWGLNSYLRTKPCVVARLLLKTKF